MDRTMLFVVKPASSSQSVTLAMSLYEVNKVLSSV